MKGYNKSTVELITPSNTIFVLGILGILFSVFRYFKDPQVKSEKDDALLGQRVEWVAQGMDRRFKDIQDSFQQLLLQSNNHIHTVDTKVEGLTKMIGQMSVEIAKLSTIIDERVPKKQ